jgi:hypothetical protein
MQVDGPLIKDTLAGGPRTKCGPHSFSHGNHPHIGTSACGSRHYAFLHPGAAPPTGLGGLLRRATRSGNGDSTPNATDYTRPMDQLWTCIYHLTLMAAQDGPIVGAVLIKKYSSYRTNQKNPPRVFSICFLPTKYSNKSVR